MLGGVGTMSIRGLQRPVVRASWMFGLVQRFIAVCQPPAKRVHDDATSTHAEFDVTSVLPLLLWSSIFSFFEFQDVVTELRRVCQTFRDACNSPLAFHHVYIGDAMPAMQWARFFTNVRSLDLRRGCISEAVLNALAPHIRNVQSLCVVMPLQVQHNPSGTHVMDKPEVLRRFSEGCKQLKVLDIQAETMSEEDEYVLLTAFSKHFAHLEELIFLHISPPNNISPALFLRVVRACPRLTHIHWDSSTKPSATTVQAMAKYCPLLQHCSLLCDTSYDTLNDESVCALADGCPNLRAMTLADCRSVTASSIAHLLSKCPSLYYLNIEKTPFSAAELNPILCAHPSVTRLLFDGDKLIGSPHLTRIKVMVGITFTRQQLIAILRLNPNVRRVKIASWCSSCSQIKKRDLITVKRMFPHVEQLIFQHNEKNGKWSLRLITGYPEPVADFMQY